MTKNESLHNLPIGGIYTTNDAMSVATVLGSCVSVCLFDKENLVSGMNHFMLPEAPTRDTPKPGDLGRYGSLSIPELIKRFERSGGKLSLTTAKVFGGAHMLSALAFANIPERNIDVALRCLAQYKIKIVNKVVGGDRGRKIVFDTKSGRVMVREVAKREFG